MLQKAFALYDSKAEYFNVPFFCPAVGMATRFVTDMLADPNNTCARHPQDFTLYQVGEFDDATGAFSNMNVLIVSCSGLLQHVARPHFRTDSEGNTESTRPNGEARL